MKRKLFVYSVLMALLALVLLASPVAAYHCKEDVNPHGDNIPPAGSRGEDIPVRR